MGDDMLPLRREEDAVIYLTIFGLMFAAALLLGHLLHEGSETDEHNTMRDGGHK